MMVFADTSGLYAFLDADDRCHELAGRTWREMTDSGSTLLTTNYVLVETYALLQSRLGIEAVRTFERDVMPVLEIEWVDREAHGAAVAALLAAGRRDLSLVDCVSFDTMRRLGVRHAFSVDRHFRDQGFVCLAAP